MTRTSLQMIFYLEFETTICKLVRQHSQCETSANDKGCCETWLFATGILWTGCSCGLSYALATGRWFTTGNCTNLLLTMGKGCISLYLHSTNFTQPASYNSSTLSLSCQFPRYNCPQKYEVRGTAYETAGCGIVFYLLSTFQMQISTFSTGRKVRWIF